MSAHERRQAIWNTLCRCRHITVATTANLYAHLEYESKLTSADTMQSVLNLPSA